ncbi:MAG: hypothetical protein JSW63_05315 [Ignavibacterium sp.]|nr:MAG: hypothetical protein JSW63_05315 [Ignavibacterium sp.]
MKKTYILLFDPGPNWGDTKEIEEQNYWNEHVKFVDNLFDKGKVVITGPIVDYDRIVIIYEAKDESEIRITFKDDPFLKNGILFLESVMEWKVRLDQRKDYQPNQHAKA